MKYTCDNCFAIIETSSEELLDQKGWKAAAGGRRPLGSVFVPAEDSSVRIYYCPMCKGLDFPKDNSQ